MGGCAGNCNSATLMCAYFFLFIFFYIMDLDVDPVQGKVRVRSFHPSPHMAKWLAMRPLVMCGDNVMTFTASGKELTYLFVNRGEVFEC